MLYPGRGGEGVLAKETGKESERMHQRSEPSRNPNVCSSVVNEKGGMHRGGEGQMRHQENNPQNNPGKERLGVKKASGTGKRGKTIPRHLNYEPGAKWKIAENIVTLVGPGPNAGWRNSHGRSKKVGPKKKVADEKKHWLGRGTSPRGDPRQETWAGIARS